MRLTPRTDGMNIIPGRAQPSQTLPPGWGVGKPGFPTPLARGLCSVHISPGSAGKMPADTRRGRNALARRRLGYPRCEQVLLHRTLTRAADWNILIAGMWIPVSLQHGGRLSSVTIRVWTVLSSSRLGSPLVTLVFYSLRTPSRAPYQTSVVTCVPVRAAAAYAGVGTTIISTQSLILAQDERWRRA